MITNRPNYNYDQGLFIDSSIKKLGLNSLPRVDMSLIPPDQSHSLIHICRYKWNDQNRSDRECIDLRYFNNES